MREYNHTQAKYGNNHTKPLSPLVQGQAAQVLNTQSKTWFPATIVEKFWGVIV
jgi:hypothetical protein